VNNKKFENSHIERAQNFPPEAEPKTVLLDWNPENSEFIIIYNEDGQENGDMESKFIKDSLVPFLQSSRRGTICFLKGGYTAFRNQYPFLCSDFPNYEDNIIYPSQVLPFLFVGSHLTTTKKSILQNLCVKHVLNLTAECGNRFESDKQLAVQYYQIPMMDSQDEELEAVFGEAFSVIDAAKNAKQNILVHCNEGKSRSCSIVIAYLMYDQRWSLSQAYLHVQSCRTICKPNFGFFQQLAEYESKLFGKSTADELMSLYM